PLRGARLACVKPAASVRSEPGSNSQVEKTLIWLVRRCSTKPQQPGHAFELTRTFTPERPKASGRLFSQKRVRQSLVRTPDPWRDLRLSRLCRPRFSFFNIQLSKNRHRKHDVV